MIPTKSSVWGKLALSFGLIIVSTIYALWQHLNGSSAVTITTPTATDQAGTSASQSLKTANEALQQTLSQIGNSSNIPTPGAVTSATPQAQPAKTTTVPTPGTASKTAGYNNGSYTGDATDAYYGTVQVKATIAGGKIIDVAFLQYPNTHSNSRFINGQAMPLLTQEALAAQSAQVDGVSGATFTSEAFKQSLASALAKAK